jgi:DNA-binding XRE family transcriptional regulator
MTFRPWEKVRDEIDAKCGFTEEEVQAAEREVDAYVTGYRLAELRKKAGITQVDLARRMGIGQPRVSAIERGDIETLTVASVRSYVEALGGTIRLVAHFDDADSDTDITLRVPEKAA